MEKKSIRWDLVPGILLFAVLPLIVRMQMTDNLLSEYPWYPMDGQRGDFFLYWKGMLFRCLSVWMAAVLVDRILIRGKKRCGAKYFIPLLLYGILIVVSTVFSVHKGLSLKGMTDQFEPVWTLLLYPLTAFYFFCVTEDKKDVNTLLAALAVGAAAQCLLGLSQVFGHSFWESSLGKRLILPETYADANVAFNFAQEEIHRVYMAAYNPNYAGVYIVIVWPIVTGLGFRAEKRTWKVGGGLVSLLLFLCLVETGSKTGMVVFLLEAAAVGLIMVRADKKYGKYFLTVFVAVMACLVICDAVTGQRILKYVSGTYAGGHEEYLLEDIKTDRDGVTLQFGGEKLHVNIEDTDIPEEMSVAGLELKKETVNDIPYLILEYRGLSWYFTNRTDDESYVYITRYGKPDTITKAKSLFPESWDPLFTYRGYIWGRTLPLLANHLIWGSGPDTFAVVFPQSDYLGRARLNNGFLTEILSRPHNWYLQTALQTGVLSLVCVLIFLWRYIKGALRTCMAGKAWEGTLILVGVCGYLIACLTNDSMLVTAPLFWGLLGMGMAVNRENA